MSDESPVEKWDIAKAKSNFDKHGVYFADAEIALEDIFGLNRPESHPDETRYAFIGMDPLLRILVVVYTYRDDNIRIISARKATPSERKQYEEVKR